MSDKNKAEDIEETVSNEEEIIENNNEAQEQEQEELSEEEQLKEELGKEKDKFLRLFAEFENYKKRTSKERMDLFKTAGQEVIVSLLPVLDDFDRALKELAHEAITQIPAPNKKMKGKVIDVIEKGFKLGDRIIRHPKVVVGK